MDWKWLRCGSIWAVIVATSLCGAASVASAQEWARKMFDHFSHDFGTLVRGQKAEHRFTFRNLYVEDVEVESVTSSCGCTIPEVTKRLLKTHETAEIVARANTTQFLGRKEATIRVRFRRPFPAEVQLHCYMYIRSDVVFDPGQFNFGTVVAGKESPALSVTATHLARGDWRIVELRAPKYVEASFRELSRQLGRTSYLVEARLSPETPAGYVRDAIVVLTNDPDPRMRAMTIQLEAIVTPALSARPSPLMLGVLTPGQKVLRKLIVQAESPFRITDVEVPSAAFRAQLPEGAAQLQVVVIEFTAPETAGRVTGVIRVKTDRLSDATVEVPVTGYVISPQESSPATPPKEPETQAKEESESGTKTSDSPPGTTTVTDQP